MEADEVIRIFDLQPLEIEGGLFKETYKCVKYAKGVPARSCGTCIYYLLKGNSVSRWHKVNSDEIWFYHAGSPAEQFLVFEDGRREKRIIGADFENGEIPQSIIPAGIWQFTSLKYQKDKDWGLFSAVVCPGFEYEDFVIGTDI